MQISAPLFKMVPILFLATNVLWGQQKMALKKVGSLHSDIEECSGISLLPSGLLAMINDSGNRPDVFFTDIKGHIQKMRCMAEVTNVDWEEIEYAEGYLYIGDFGNNRNKRKDLVIYKYSITENDSATYNSEIHFKYADQEEFAPADKDKNYDLEAMVHFNDSLFIFTKNRTKPFTGYTYMYGMPARAGRYNLSRIDSFKTGTEGKHDYWWISAAAINPSKDKLALLGYDKVWVFSDFYGSAFFKGKSTVYQFETLTQKEAITFLNDNDFVITDERNRFGGGDVYHGSFPRQLGQLASHNATKQDTNLAVSIKQTEIADTIIVHISGAIKGKVLWEIFTTNGHRIKAGNQLLQPKESFIVIESSELPPGGYVLNVIIDGKPNAFKLKKYYPLQKE
jgi:hypothetical protein